MHHTRRKSGHAATNNSTTEARRAVTASDAKPRRPQTLTRKSTPQTVLKLGKSPKDREKELEEERWFDDERETFPQFCMTCEKQFTPQDEKILYCSEACRERDQDTSVRVSSSRNSSRGHEGFGAGLPYYSVGNSEPRDIIPRASPSRWSPPTTPTTGQHSNAISVLRSLSILPVTPTSPLTGNISGNAGLPFTRSAVTSPSTSYTKSANHFYSSTYDNGYAVTGYGYPQGGMTDRPLPSRKPGAYSRPKSIELVTPIVGR